MIPFLKSFLFAFKGITDLFSQHRNAMIHIAGAVVAVSAGFYFRISPIEWCIITVCIGLVISMEGINTAIEYLTDLVSPEYNKQAGKVKDMAAGAVLIVAIAAFICACLIFIPKITRM